MSDAQVAINKNSDRPRAKVVSLGGGWGTVSQLKFVKTSGIVWNESS